MNWAGQREEIFNYHNISECLIWSGHASRPSTLRQQHSAMAITEIFSLTLVSEDISSEVPVDWYLSCVRRWQQEQEEEEKCGSCGHHLTTWDVHQAAAQHRLTPVCASLPSPHLSPLLSSSTSTPVIYNLQSSTGPFLNNTKLTSYRHYMVSI